MASHLSSKAALMVAFFKSFLYAVVILNSFANPAEILNVRLLGGTGEYIDARSSMECKLTCEFRAGYDDQVQEPLTGHVSTDPQRKDPFNIDFRSFDHEMMGNYTCQVVSQKGTVNSPVPFHLTIIDVASPEFFIDVHLLKDGVEEDANSSFVSPSEEGSDYKDEDCILVWDFKSPAIFPMPNITCGYYSYKEDDIMTYIPAGLTMHKFMNGSWQANIKNTRVSVSDVPALNRLGCSIKIPETSYRKVVKFEDGFTIDHMIDSVGCLSLNISSAQKLEVQVRGATISCRGEILPTSRESPATVFLRCPRGTFAYFSNGDVVWDWEEELYCSSSDLTWKYNRENLQEENTGLNFDERSNANLQELPYCVADVNISGRMRSTILLIAISLCARYLI